MVLEEGAAKACSAQQNQLFGYGDMSILYDGQRATIVKIDPESERIA